MKIKLLFLSLVFISVSQHSNAQELSAYPGFWKMQYFEDSHQISKNEFINLIYQDTESAALWDKSKKHMAYAWGAFGVQLGFLVWQINRRNNGDSQVLPLVGGLSAGAVAIGFGLSSSSLKKKSILRYNANFDKEETGYINFGPTYNGMGFVVSF